MSTAPTVAIGSLASAPWYVFLHLALALAALGIGIWSLCRRKGDRLHRALGWSWAILMLSTAAVSFLIQGRGHFSFIHALSIVVLVSVPVGVLHARRGRVKAHRYTMVSTFAGLAIAGALTLLPYRMLGQIVFEAR